MLKIGNLLKKKLAILAVFTMTGIPYGSTASLPEVQNINPDYYIESMSEVIATTYLDDTPRIKRVYLTKLVDIFTHKKPTWIDGSPIVVINFPDGSIEQKLFIIQNLAMTPYQYKTRKDRYLYRGRGMPPIIVRTQEQMLQKLLTTNNSIGYMSNRMYYKDDKRLYVVEVIY